MPNDRHASKLWWAVPAAGFLVLLTLAMLFGGEPERVGHATSYDASADGFRAAYLLLEELGFPVYRLKRPTAEGVRWVLFPTAAAKEGPQLDAWVRAGGLLLLADDKTDFAQALGIELRVTDRFDAGVRPADGLGVERLAVGSTFVDWPAERGNVLVTAGGKPAVTVYRRGQGEIWLVQRPDLVTNRRLREEGADNALLLARLAAEMLERRPGRLAFDEFAHGLRDRPGVTELLFRPPALWVTLHALALLALLLAHYVPRFGTILSPPAPTRRSKEEFLNALASLLERKGDYAAAYTSVRDHVARELEHELGLPAGTPAEAIAREAARRRTIDARRLERLLTGAALPARAGAHAFLTTLNELEAARDEFFSGRPPR